MENTLTIIYKEEVDLHMYVYMTLLSMLVQAYSYIHTDNLRLMSTTCFYTFYTSLSHLLQFPIQSRIKYATMSSQLHL